MIYAAVLQNKNKNTTRVLQASTEEALWTLMVEHSKGAKECETVRFLRVPSQKEQK